MATKDTRLEQRLDPLTAPAKVMAEKWDSRVVYQTPLLHGITEGVFPITGTLSTEKLTAIRQMFTQAEEKYECEHKLLKHVKYQTNWVSFRKWEREAGNKQEARVVGLMLKQLVHDEGGKEDGDAVIFFT